jgi:tRNA pseudouridine55 synthase
LLLIDKAVGPTSHDCVARVRRLASTKKVGHAGTLDPLASGLLVLGLGRATRLLTYLVGLDKTYTATIRLGASTTTDDAAGSITYQGVASGLSAGEVETAMARWRGRVPQVPSAVSAIKVDGQRAYARVRDGQEVKLKAREVTIRRFDLLDWRLDGPFLDLDVLVECSSGTYVRALARDLGADLAVGGHLTALRRQRVGPFSLESAHTLAALGASEGVRGADLRAAVMPMAQAASLLWPVRELTAEETRRLSHGQMIDGRAAADVIAAISPEGSLVALLTHASGTGPNARLRPLAVFV